MAVIAFPTMLEKLVQIWFTVFPKFTSHAFTVSQFLYSRAMAAATAMIIPSGPIRADPNALNAFVTWVIFPEDCSSAIKVFAVLNAFTAVVTAPMAGPSKRRPAAMASTVPLCSHRKDRNGLAFSYALPAQSAKSRIPSTRTGRPSEMAPPAQSAKSSAISATTGDTSSMAALISGILDIRD